MPVTASVATKRTAGPGGESLNARPAASALAAHGGWLTSSHLYPLTKWAWTTWDSLIWLVDTALPIALPTSPARTWWTVWFLLLVLYSAVDVPLHIAFESWRLLKPVTCLSWLCCVTFCMDIILRFRTSHITWQGENIRTPRLVAKHYLRGMFLLDLVSALPLDEIIDVITGGHGHHNAYWIGLLRVPRLFITMRQLNSIIPVKYYNFVSVAKLLGVMLLSTHWAACMWYYLAFDEVRGNWQWIFTAGGCSSCSDLGRYLFAFYRCFLILLGDRPEAYNNVERIFVLVLLLLGACLYAVVMGSMTLLVSNIWSMASRHKQRAAMLQDALRYNGASAGTELRSRVDQYFDFMATHEHPGAEGVALLAELPTALHSELMSTVFEPLLTRVQLFAFCERAFVWRLAQRLRLATFMPKDILYGVGSVGHDMFIIWRGIVALTEPDGCMTALLGEGDHFGELGVMAANTPRPQRAVALCATDVLILSRSDMQDAMRDFPDSAGLVRTRAQVQLEDHEIGPAVWAATMAVCKDMEEAAADDSSDVVPVPPRCSAERAKSALPQVPNPRSNELGTGCSGGSSSANDMAASSTAKSPWPGAEVTCRRRPEGTPAASLWRRQYLLGRVQGGVAVSRAASPGPGPVAEATEAGADGGQRVGTTLLTSMGGTALGSHEDDSCRRPSSLSSEDSFFEALGLKAGAAGPGNGGAQVGAQGAWNAGHRPSAAPSIKRWKAPSLPGRSVRRARRPTSDLQLEELLVEPRQSVGLGSTRTQGEPGLIKHDAGLGPHTSLHVFGDDVGSPRGGSRAATANTHAVVPQWLASMQPCSPTAGTTPRKQQQQQQQSPHPAVHPYGFNPRELAALERVRFSSTRPVESGGVTRYLSKRARQEASAAAVPSSRPSAAGAAPGDPFTGSGTGPQAAAACLIAAPPGEDSSNRRGVSQELNAHDLVERSSSSAGQQRPPTAPQMLLMTPQPFLGVDPLVPLFDQAAPALGGVSALLGLRWHGRSATQTTMTDDGNHPPTPFGDTEDSTTRQLVAPLCRRSIRTLLRGSGRPASGSSFGKFASAGSSERCIGEWLNDQQQTMCHQARCAQLEQQVSQLKRQLAAAHARLDTIMEDPLKEPSIQALVQQKVQAAVAALSTRTEELLQQLLDGLLGVSARTEDLSQQVSAADERLKHIEVNHAGDFAAAMAGTAMTVGLRLPPLVAAAADGGGGGVLVDAPIQGPESQGRNGAAPLAGLLRPSGATAGQMGALLPLSTSSARASLGRQSSLRQQMPGHLQRRGSMLSFKSAPWEDMTAEAGTAVSGAGVPSDAALLGTLTSLPVPDAALLAATMSRAAGKNVRRRQSARDLSVLTSNTIAAQQQQQELRELREQHSMFQQALETSAAAEPAASRDLSRANSRAEGVRPVQQRSSSLFGMVFQAGERLSPTGTLTLRRGIGRKSSRALVEGEDGAQPQAATAAAATTGGAATECASSRSIRGSSSGQPGNEAGISEITPAAQEEERPPRTASSLQRGNSSGYESPSPPSSQRFRHLAEIGNS